MSSRRNFLKKLVSGSAGVVALSSVSAAELFGKIPTRKLTILHTNDMHSHIDPFPDNDPKYPGLGGMSRRAALISKIRAEEENVVVVDCGDIFQGTPYFNQYGGELEFKLMSEMNYDAATIGNHDFDNGLEGLAKMLPHANFPFLSANYDFSSTLLAGKTKRYIVLKRKGIRIGIFGIGVELAGLVDPDLYGKTIYQDPVQKANECAATLVVKERCDIVICLSHLGYHYDSAKISDTKLAVETTNIDVILGGHTHTFLDGAQTFVGKEGKKVLVNQVGWAGVKLGRIDLFFGAQKDAIFSSSQNTFISNLST